MPLDNNRMEEIKLLLQDVLFSAIVKLREIDPTLNHESLKPIIFSKITNELAKEVLTDSKIFENVLENSIKSIENDDVKSVLSERHKKEKSNKKSGDRRAHNPREDLEILTLANNRGIDGFSEEELVVYLDSKLDEIIFGTLRNKLSRFCRSPKNFLKKRGTKQYCITPSGIKELSILRKRLDFVES